LKILLVDDHALVRRGLRSLLEMEIACSIHEAGTGSQALELALGETWNLVILDLGLPGRDGIDVLRAIRQAKPKLPVLVLTVHEESQLGIRALRAGASGYLTKEAAAEQVVAAVRTLLAGEKYLSPQLAAQIAAALGFPHNRPAYEQLSDREFQVLQLLTLGKTVTEAAEELSLSVKTVSTYRTRILEKLSFRSNADLVKFALQTGLLRAGL
jgi:two-component system, NarL family, invasion response regulator UvrY